MLQILIVVVFTFCTLMGAEWLSRKKHIHPEITRKLVHIVVGTFVAFWPFFMTWGQIQLVSAAYLVVVLFSIRRNVFRAIHTVHREAYGEVLFALAIGALAFLATSKWIFLTSMLSLSLADGFAAIFGVLYGEAHRYKVFGRPKSVVGTATFFVITLLLTATYGLFSNGHSSLTMLAVVPIMATITENISAGFDNLVVPVLVTILLSSSL